mmetsp:Transcript_27384/g.84079  ORF Transcript_27384/g.84079 Transcript_27384/m.84079 type:complete len:297 (+) Transcript_27384:1207-2097(+)
MATLPRRLGRLCRTRPSWRSCWRWVLRRTAASAPASPRRTPAPRRPWSGSSPTLRTPTSPNPSPTPRQRTRPQRIPSPSPSSRPWASRPPRPRPRFSPATAPRSAPPTGSSRTSTTSTPPAPPSPPRLLKAALPLRLRTAHPTSTTARRTTASSASSATSARTPAPATTSPTSARPATASSSSTTKRSPSPSNRPSPSATSTSTSAPTSPTPPPLPSPRRIVSGLSPVLLVEVCSLLTVLLVVVALLPQRAGHWGTTTSPAPSGRCPLPSLHETRGVRSVREEAADTRQPSVVVVL